MSLRRWSDELLRRQPRARIFRKQVDELPVLEVTGELVLAFGCEECGEPGFLRLVRRFGGEGLDDFAGRLGQGQPAGQRLAQRDGRSELEHRRGDRFGAGRTEAREQLIHFRRPVGREYPEGVAGLVGEAAVAEVHDEVARLLVRARLVQQAVLAQSGGVGQILAEWAGRGRLVHRGELCRRGRASGKSYIVRAASQGQG